MEITKGEALAGNADISNLVDERASVLNEEMDLTAGKATWDLETDERGRPLLRLKVADAVGGQGSARFSPDELRHEDHLRGRLHSLKDGVLWVGKWRARVRDLLDDIRRWCQALPGAYLSEEPALLRELGAGEFEVTRLVLSRGRARMRVEPIAAWVVGAEGRVDLKGVGTSFILLYDHKAGWYYLEDRIPPRSHPLTEALFLELARACLDG